MNVLAEIPEYKNMNIYTYEIVDLPLSFCSEAIKPLLVLDRSTSFRKKQFSNFCQVKQNTSTNLSLLSILLQLDCWDREI